MLKKLAATGILGFAVSGAIMVAAAPANADAYGGGHGHHGGGGHAHSVPKNLTAGNHGILNGTQVPVNANIPVTVCGVSANVITLLSQSGAGCKGNDQLVLQD
ncbi:hypothetical protein GCM10010191_11870 [Actinomadura vinacea]|uniref:Chaplin domain-containing protein n=1 Tax=Actinomadura vinacea TaxID=115336 RepID=A0ABP5VKL0_9ACTN